VSWCCSRHLHLLWVADVMRADGLRYRRLVVEELVVEELAVEELAAALQGHARGELVELAVRWRCLLVKHDEILWGC